jgi:hypothetical protein
MIQVTKSAVLTKKQLFNDLKTTLMQICKDNVDEYLIKGNVYCFTQWFRLINGKSATKFMNEELVDKFLNERNDDENSKFIQLYAIAWCERCSDNFFEAEINKDIDDVLLLLSEPNADVEMKMWLASRGKSNNETNSRDSKRS